MQKKKKKKPRGVGNLLFIVVRESVTQKAMYVYWKVKLYLTDIFFQLAWKFNWACWPNRKVLVKARTISFHQELTQLPKAFLSWVIKFMAQTLFGCFQFNLLVLQCRRPDDHPRTPSNMLPAFISQLLLSRRFCCKKYRV